tara:strand:- start:4529 stop:4768 length:240 start_codon:yes stop_codon:yes gene_type:complete
MNNQVITSFIISTIYFVFKFAEMRLIIKENRPLKHIFIDTLIVFISATLGIILLDQFNLNEIIGNIKATPSVFVSKPDF